MIFVSLAKVKLTWISTTPVNISDLWPDGVFPWPGNKVVKGMLWQTGSSGWKRHFVYLLNGFLLCSTLFACKMNPNSLSPIPSRYQDLPNFNPHLANFLCKLESTEVPQIDAQANVWFLEALALENADIVSSKRDYARIVQLTRQAAERHHWKAMLNLASLYVAGKDNAHGEEAALQWVEQAMGLGVPAAYDRMGTYFINGTGLNSNSARAYAFWQRAAEMGNPSAMAYLGKKFLGVWDDPQGSFWNNRPNGIKMLECAFSQGEGKAAYYLGLSYHIQPGRDSTREERWRALQILHEGVKFGSKDCANSLDIEFGHPLEMSKMLAPSIDRARAKRYSIFYDALSFDPTDRFPNLDKVLPLPPARLPPWNGDRDTLLRAARGVTAPAAVPEPTAASQRSGRYFLEAGFALRDTGQETQATSAPMEGYWQPQVRSVKPEEQEQLKAVMPGLYRRGEAFASFMSQHGHGALTGIIWRRWDTVRLPLDAVAPLAPVGMTTSVPRPLPLQTCSAGEACPVTGTWQPWVRSDHPLHLAINQYWRQAWLVKGQTPPDPQRDWHLPIAAADVTWHLMDSSPVNLLNDGE